MNTKFFILLSIIILLIFCCVIIYITYRKDLNNYAKRIDSIESQIFKSNIGNIEYYLEGKGPTILISHGVTGGIDQGIGLSNLYLGKGYRYLYISRFGYLKSSIPDNPSAKLQAKAYKDLLDFLGIDSVFIFGNSAGGTSAIHFAIDYPERSKGLILVSSAVPENERALPPKPLSKAVFGSDFLYWATLKLFGRNMIQLFVPKSIYKQLSRTERKNLISDIMFSGLPISNRTKGVLFDIYVSNPSMDKGLAFESINLPTLIIHALDDPAPPFVGARTISIKISNSELLPFETGGHLILNHEKEIKHAIQNFVFR